VKNVGKVLTEGGVDGTGTLSSVLTRSARFSSADLVSIVKRAKFSSIFLTVYRRE